MAIPTSNYTNLRDKHSDQLLSITDYGITSINQKSGSIATSNSFGTSLPIYGLGKALVVFSGTWTATVFSQLSLSTAATPATWYDLSSYTGNQVVALDYGVACSIRVGIKTGDYTSGTMNYFIKTGGRP
jgi:hypothetical protein